MEQVSSLKTGVKYKDTPIGKIPVDWEVLKLNNIGELKGGNGFSEKYQGHRDLKYLFIKVSDMNLPCNDIYIRNSINTIDDELKEILKCNIFPRDTIVFAKVGAALLLNRRRIITKESAIDNNMMGLIVKKGYYPKFYYYILQTIDFAKYVFSGALPSVNQKIIGDIDVVSPPLNEQKGIAEILTTADKAIEKTSQIIEKTKELKKGLMQRLLTKGIGHKRFKRTKIGEIPEVWTTIKLNDVVKLSSGKPRPKDFIPEYGRDSIYPIYGGNGILGYSSKFNFENKTIILGRVGEYCGVVHRNDGKCWISDNALYIKELKYSFFDLQFLALSLEYKDLNKYKSQSGQPLISQRVLYNLQLALPPIDEQKKISAIISEITNMLENEQSHKSELEQIKKGLMQVLLTGKLRVAV